MGTFVSVIIPNYNHSKFLKERIDSVLNQTFQNFEVIILDDCSKDNSKEIIEQILKFQNTKIKQRDISKNEHFILNIFNKLISTK